MSYAKQASPMSARKEDHLMVLQREVAKLSVAVEDAQQELVHLRTTSDTVTPTLIDLQEKMSSSAKAIKLCLSVTEDFQAQQNNLEQSFRKLQSSVEHRDAARSNELDRSPLSLAPISMVL